MAKQIFLPLHIRFQGAVQLIVVLGLGVAVALTMTAVNHGISEYWKAKLPITFQQVVGLVNLAGENNVGVWFSSVLLLLIAGASIICFIMDCIDRPNSKLNAAWLVLSFIFALLSYDEMGSFHERVFAVPGVWGWVGWMVPFLILVPFYMGTFAWLRLRRRPDVLALFLCGLVLFATIPLQEMTEQVDHRPTSELLLEEGSELVAMLFFMTAICLYILPRKETPLVSIAKRSRKIEITFGLSTAVWAVIAFALLSLASMSGMDFVLESKPDPLIGIQRNWFPSAAAAGAMLLSFYLSLGRRWGKPYERWLFGSIAVISGAFSAYVGGNVYALKHWLGIPARLLLLTAVLLAAATLFRLCMTKLAKGGTAWWAIFASIALLALPDYVSFLLLLAFVGLVVTLIHLLPMMDSGSRLPAEKCRETAEYGI
jgi:hypothetical protein